MDRWMGWWVGRCMGRWVNGWVTGEMGDWMDGWVGRWINEREWMNGLVDGRVSW